MKIERFEDIVAWQKARVFVVGIYNLFSESRDFSFRDQICRASVSIMNNIAEGFERKTNNEFKQFLYIAKGSCGEVRSMLYLSRDLEKMSESDFLRLFDNVQEISRMISGFIKKL